MNIKLYDYILQTLRDIYSEMDLVKNENDPVKRADIVDNYMKESVDLLTEEINILIKQQSQGEKNLIADVNRLQGELDSYKERWFLF